MRTNTIADQLREWLRRAYDAGVLDPDYFGPGEPELMAQELEEIIADLERTADRLRAGLEALEGLLDPRFVG